MPSPRRQQTRRSCISMQLAQRKTGVRDRKKTKASVDCIRSPQILDFNSREMARLPCQTADWLMVPTTSL